MTGSKAIEDALSDIARSLRKLVEPPREQPMPDDDLLHPSGRCSCCGEGSCQWCRMTAALEERDEARALVRRVAALDVKLAEVVNDGLADLSRDVGELADLSRDVAAAVARWGDP